MSTHIATAPKRSRTTSAVQAGWLAWTRRLELWGTPLLLLAMRLWMASIFFRSGLTRVTHWDSQAFLFANIHPLPGVPPMAAAVVTTGAELTLPVLLALGLFGRLSALAMFIMTCVIQFVVANTPAGIENGIGNSDHYLWMLLLAAVVVSGPGALSVDRLLGRRLGARPA